MKRSIIITLLLVLTLIVCASAKATSINKGSVGPEDRYIIFTGQTHEELAIDVNTARAGGCKLRGELIPDPVQNQYLQVMLCPKDFSIHGGFSDPVN